MRAWVALSLLSLACAASTEPGVGDTSGAALDTASGAPEDTDGAPTDVVAAPADGEESDAAGPGDDAASGVGDAHLADAEGTEDLGPPPPPAAISGVIRIFGPPGGPLAGATITILEHPDLSAVSDEDGRYTLPEVPAGDVTLVMQAEGYPENQLGTQTLEGADLDGCDFQAVSAGVYDIFAMLTESTPDPARCQISTTITRYFEGGLPTVHGEPGATATIEPAVSSEPIYFNADVLPTPGLVETTVDGGVVWTNVEPGKYVLSAHKGELPFKDVRIWCRAGVLVNAAPPRGLQALAPGDGY